VGVAELSAGRVAWARDAEAMSKLGNLVTFFMTFSDFQSRIAGSPRLSSPSLLYIVFQAYLRILLISSSMVFRRRRGET